MTTIYRCKWCDYVGSEGLFHVREKHPDHMAKFTIDNRRDWVEKQKKERAERPLGQDVIDGIIMMEMVNRFTYHRPDKPAIDDMKDLRNLLCHIAVRIMHKVPDGRERALAITKLEEAMMWANAGIVRQSPFEEKSEIPEGT